MRLKTLTLDKIGSWVTDLCFVFLRSEDYFQSLASVSDFLRGNLPLSLLNDIWRHLLHSFLPLVHSSAHARAVLRVFQGRVGRHEANPPSLPNSPVIVTRLNDINDADMEAPESMEGVRGLELLRGVWTLQSGKLWPPDEVNDNSVESPVFQDLNFEWRKEVVEEESPQSPSSSSSSSSSIDLDTSESESEKESENKSVKCRVMLRPCKVRFPESLEFLHISSGFVTNLPTMISKCLADSPCLKTLCLTDIQIQDWFFPSLLGWTSSLSELHLFRCPSFRANSPPPLSSLSSLHSLTSLSLLSCDWSLAALRLRFAQLETLDLSWDLVTKVTADKLRRSGDLAPPPDIAEARRDLVRFVEMNMGLRYIGLINHPLSELEEVESGRYGSRRICVGGAASTPQMITAIKYHRENQHVGSWGGMVRQHLLKYSMTDRFTLTEQWGMMKRVWSFSDRDLLLFVVGDRYKRLTTDEERKMKIVARVLRLCLVQMSLQPRGCGHDVKQALNNAKGFIFAADCVDKSILNEMWTRLFEDFVKEKVSLASFDSSPRKVHLFVDFLKRATMLVSASPRDLGSLRRSLTTAYSHLLQSSGLPQCERPSSRLTPVLRRRPSAAPIRRRQFDYESLLLLWMLSTTRTFGDSFIADFPLVLPGLRRLVRANAPYLDGVDSLLRPGVTVSLPDGDGLVPVFGIILTLLIKVPSSPFVFSLVKGILQRCWNLLQVSEVSPLLSLLSIGILAFTAPDYMKDSVPERDSFFRARPRANVFLDHCLRVWSLQRGVRTAANHIAFGFPIVDALQPFVALPSEDVDGVEYRCLRSRFAELAVKVFSPGYALYAAEAR